MVSRFSRLQLKYVFDLPTSKDYLYTKPVSIESCMLNGKTSPLNTIIIDFKINKVGHPDNNIRSVITRHILHISPFNHRLLIHIYLGYLIPVSYMGGKAIEIFHSDFH